LVSFRLPANGRLLVAYAIRAIGRNAIKAPPATCAAYAFYSYRRQRRAARWSCHVGVIRRRGGRRVLQARCVPPPSALRGRREPEAIERGPSVNVRQRLRRYQAVDGARV